MKRTNGPPGHRAGPPLVAVTLVAALALAFLPLGPAPVIALTAADPSASPTPSVSDSPSPSPDPSPTPTPDLTPSPDPSAPPTPTPDASPPPDASPSPAPSPSGSPSPSPAPTPFPPDVVGPDGGSVSAGPVTVTVPGGAVAAPTRIAIAGATGLPDFDGRPPLVGVSVDATDAETGAPVSFAAPVTLTVATAGLALGGIELADLRIARLSGGAWSALATAVTSGSLSASIDGPGTYGVVEQLAPAEVTITHTSSAPSAGRHRIDPGSNLTVQVSLTPKTKLNGGRLIETVPAGWAVVDAGGGTRDQIAGTITWALTSVTGDTTVSRTIELTAPGVPLPDGRYAVPATFSARFVQAGGTTRGADLDVLVAPRVAVEHRTLAKVTSPRLDPVYLSEDAPILDEQRFEVFRVRFEVRNPDTVATIWTPRLEFRRLGHAGFAAVPTPDTADGSAFYAAPEWVVSRVPGEGTEIGPAGAVIDAASLAGDQQGLAGGSPVAGYRSMGANPAPAMDLPGLSWSVVEFSARATVDAAYLAGYEFRLTDAGIPLAGAAVALVWLGPPPAIELTPGQRDGLPPELPSPAMVGVSAADVQYALVAPAGPDSPAQGSAVSSPGAADPVHGPYSLATDACAACHRSHEASGSSLLVQPAPQYGLCAACHAAAGPGPDVVSRYAAAPANDPLDRAYYQHDPTAVSTHTLSRDDGSTVDEFSGRYVRHNECSDCHNPHNSSATAPVQGANGWTASGWLAGASGVAVTNGAAGSTPTYTLTGATALEYQLCFTCHSSFTTLPSNAGLAPSRYALDKGVEFNPNNLSYHPIEAAGTNGTPAMAASLAGTSPFKQWNFSTTSTIRCLNCHADSATFDASLPTAGGTALAAGSTLPAHSSANRGILLQPYRDRLLKGRVDPYSATDFALCFLCHSEAPFRDTSGDARSDTNFRFHGFHVDGNELRDKGAGGTDIDIAGAGAGLATCAECHFRLHSTAFPVNDQASAERLVNFAPNVTAPTGGTLRWLVKTGVQDGSCTLTCHGQSHTPKTY